MLEVLNTLTIKGLAQADELAEATGYADSEVIDLLTGWAESGLVRLRSGRMSGWAVTPEGRAERDRLLAECVVGDQVAEGYQRFLPLNIRFKALCTRWQDRTNDTDIQFARDGVAEIHGEVVPLIEKLGMPRFMPYQRRLSGALARFEKGEVRALTFPRSNSYHDIWMELHADLLATLGRDRSSADEG
jgi:hypothetical protein